MNYSQNVLQNTQCVGSAADKFAIVIVNHNTCLPLAACLDSAQREGAAEIVVVDNASSDGSAEMVRRRYPGVKLIANRHNPGYGAAANQAIAASGRPFLLLLNSDTQLQTGCLKALGQYMEEHPRFGLLGPRLSNPDGSLQPSCYPFPTLLPVFLQETRLERLVAVLPLLRERYLRTWSHDRPRRVPWVLGAALAIRRTAFEEVGGFDPGFYLYAEEVDLCLRMAQAGWETHFIPQAGVIHTGGASTRQRRAEMAVQFYESLLHFYSKHYSAASRRRLELLLKGIVLARWLRDSVRLGFGLEHRPALTQDLLAWRRILATKKGEA